ncbi:HsdM family class I SAM-dependent methyltransferase [Metamycoplasma salivarium]|uniref:HsdM family class I SAM-dependent methyltransferase n=1 Tax=Metamycoplasma salivarium TaxID=2124 RepID=UPI001F445DD4|nr:class I SAM-dependent DNA methyltransferase [Metamycoplasma salivarium]GIZ06447.1 DNA methyltransferase [Metamycoplasma salivarium]
MKIDKNLLWKSAEKLRGSVHPSEYMSVILGLVFLKYVSDKYEIRYKQLKLERNGDENDPDAYIEKNIYIVPNESRWEYIAKYSKQRDIGVIIDNALEKFEKANPIFKDVLPKIYSKSEIDPIKLGALVDLFTNNFNFEENDESGDALGEIYQFFMGEFSRKLGEKGGEFYTPPCIVKLLVAILNPTKGRVYDPCCGSGGMFVYSNEFVKAHSGNTNNISIYGQELNANTWKLAKMNLAIYGISNDLGKTYADTFHNDQHKDLKFHYILANPPFNVSDYGAENLVGDKRWVFGEPPSGNANYAWLQHMYSKLDDGGMAGIVMAKGSLTGSQEKEIRKKMIESNIVECIVLLPDNLFYTVTLGATLWFLKKNKLNNEILFIDAREMGQMVNRKVRELTQSDINKITTTYQNWKKNENYKDISGFCKSATIKDIEAKNYSLMPGQYVGIPEIKKMTNEELKIEISKLKLELFNLFQESNDLEIKLKKILEQEEK